MFADGLLMDRADADTTTTSKNATSKNDSTTSTTTEAAATEEKSNKTLLDKLKSLPGKTANKTKSGAEKAKETVKKDTDKGGASRFSISIVKCSCGSPLICNQNKNG